MKPTLSRRQFSGACVFLPLLGALVAPSSRGAVPTPEAVIESSGGHAPRLSKQIAVDVPASMEAPGTAEVRVATTLPGVRSITVFVDANPKPLSARFYFKAGADARLKTRVRVPGTTRIRAVVETDQGHFQAFESVGVA